MDDNQQEVGDVRDVSQLDILKEGSPYTRLWQPFIAKWKPGHYVVAYGAEVKPKLDMGDLKVVVSEDKGVSWSTPRTIFQHNSGGTGMLFGYANPVLYHPPGQDLIWCFAMRCPFLYRDSEESTLCAAYSADGGWTWQQVEVANHFHSPLITVGGIHRVATQDGFKYLLPAHRNTIRHDPQGDRRHFILESTSLLEWKLAAYIPVDPKDNVFPHEGCIDEGSNTGELAIVMRTATYDEYKQLPEPVAYSSTSKDGGRTWSTAIPEPLLHNTVSKAFFGKDSNGCHIYVYSDGQKMERRSLSYRIRPQGGTWSEPRLFYHENNRNSYPALIEESPGVWVSVWDSSDDLEKARTAIRFGRITGS